MIKKIHLSFISLLLLLNSLEAQTVYTMTYSSQSYTPLNSPIVLAGNADFIGSYYSINLGFNFMYFGMPYSEITFSTDGYCYMGTAASYGFYTMYTNLKGLGSSQIGYVFDAGGGGGNKILKIEWKSVGFTNDVTNTDSASFQIWLYETSNKIEFHFGKWYIDPSHFNALFQNTSGLFEAFNHPSGTPYYNVWGNPSMPSFASNPTVLMYLSGYPSDGMVYTFAPGVQSGIVEKSSELKVDLYPQPAIDFIYLDQSNLPESAERYSIVNIFGEIVKEDNIHSKKQIIDLSGLTSGIYYLRVKSNIPILSTLMLINR